MSEEMPQYQCHKRVRALKITSIEPDANGADLYSDGILIRVDAEFMRVHPALDVGGYYVVYADGYKSYSPAKAFEEGYTMVGAEEYKPPRFCDGMVATVKSLVSDIYGRMWVVDPENGEIRPARVADIINQRSK